MAKLRYCSLLLLVKALKYFVYRKSNQVNSILGILVTETYLESIFFFLSSSFLVFHFQPFLKTNIVYNNCLREFSIDVIIILNATTNYS